jgi:hypothetical protein
MMGRFELLLLGIQCQRCSNSQKDRGVATMCLTAVGVRFVFFFLRLVIHYGFRVTLAINRTQHRRG